MSYSLRVGLISAMLALATLAAVVLAPKETEISVVAQTPNGSAVALDSAISVSFSRPVERRSAERSFALYPPVRGRFTWRDQTLIFQPFEPLRPKTSYRVTIRPGLRDTRGYTNRFMTSWPFRTR
jgi:Bacterial Ig-like domain